MPNGLELSSSIPLALGDGRDGIEGRYAWHRRDGFASPLLLLPGSMIDAARAALVLLDGDALDRAEAVIRFLRAWQGRAAPDTRLTPLRRWRIPRELRAADARADQATYREIAAALHGADRIAAEEDWKSSPLRTEAINLVTGGKALIAGGYRKLFHHRRRS